MSVVTVGNISPFYIALMGTVLSVNVSLEILIIVSLEKN